jgi:hypothetical protein
LSGDDRLATALRVGTAPVGGVPSRTRRGFPVRRALFLIAGFALVGFGLGIGLEYYLLPLDQRPFSALYDRFRPAGTFGLRYGIIGTSLITAGVFLYSMRKRLRLLARAGKLKYWLEFHIFVCTVGPFLVLLHTSFKVGGLVSIAFWSMTVVALSGVFGRYVYVRIPKTVHGQFANLGQIQQQRESLLTSLADRLGPRFQQVEQLLSAARRAPTKGFISSIAAAIRFDFTRRRTLRRVRKILSATAVPANARHAVVELVEEQLQIEQQIALLSPFQRLFRYWHLFHLPLAIVMFAIVAVHVVIATMFGYGIPR